VTYVVRVGGIGAFLSFEEKTFEKALERYRACREIHPDKLLTVHNEEKYDADWDGERWVVFDGMTQEEKEALDAV
jgi:hypothetical protein